MQKTAELPKIANIPIYLPNSQQHQFKYLTRDGLDYYLGFCRGIGCTNRTLSKKVGMLLANLVEMGITPVSMRFDSCFGPTITLSFRDNTECDIALSNHTFSDGSLWQDTRLNETGIVIDQHPSSYQQTKVWAGNDRAFDDVTDACELAGIRCEFEY